MARTFKTGVHAYRSPSGNIYLINHNLPDDDPWRERIITVTETRAIEKLLDLERNNDDD